MISVVIPVHNREHLIVRAIESVAAQTHPVDEIIVVDDASSDRTAQVVAAFKAKLNNLTLISLQENGGAANARNVGVKIAKGDLIAFLDSDDVWYPHKLAKQVKEFEKDKDIVAVCCGMVQMIKTYKEYRHSYIPKPSITQTDLYYSSVVGTMSVAVVRKTALLDAGGFDTSLIGCEDWDFFLRLSECGKITVVQEVLLEYWRHRGDRLSLQRRNMLADHERIFTKIYGKILDPSLKNKVRASHQRRLADIFDTDFFDPLQAIKHSYRSLILAPSRESWHHLYGVTKSSLKNGLWHFVRER